jgi:hypothetical protein
MKIITIIPVSIIALFSFFGLGLSSCGLDYTSPTPSWKNDTILPAITSTGANTFGCKLNGEYWLAVPKKEISGSYSGGAISIRMDKSGDGKEGTIILTSNRGVIFSSGNYIFNTFLKAYYSAKGKIYVSNDTNNVGYLNIIKLDSINRILSGTFEFEAHNTSINPNKVAITSGRFDFKY